MLRLLGKSLSVMRFRFATGKQNTNAKEEDEDITLAFFYRRLLRNTRVKSNGNSKFNPFDLHYMAKLAEQPHQADLLLQAYYNFLGHNTTISQKTVDIVVQKCIAINPIPDKVLDLYERHHLVGYFPHYNTTQKLLDSISDNGERLSRFSNILHYNPFIKLNRQMTFAFLEVLKSHGLNKQMRRFFLESIQRSPQLLQSSNAIRYLETVTNIPLDKVTSVLEKLQQSSQSQNIHSLARIYIKQGKPLSEITAQLSKLKAFDVEGIEETFESILARSQSLYSRKPQLYEQFVAQYSNTIKKLNKNQTLQELETRILNVSNEPNSNNQSEQVGENDETPK